MDLNSRSRRVSILVITALLLIIGWYFPPSAQGNDAVSNIPGTRNIPDGFSVSICTWKDNRSGALSITYDDGLNSQIKNASSIMSLLELNGTFFVTIDNVGIPYGGTWGQWQTVADNGHEIASHSKSHPDLTTLTYPQLYEEVVDTKRYIEDNLTNVKCQTFSYPMGLYNETVMDMVRTYYLAARQDRHNITADPAPVPSSPYDMYSIVPVEFGAGETASELNGLVDQTISSSGWLVEMIHAVGSGGYDPVDIGEFTSHVQYVANSRDDLWVAPFSNVSKYVQVRDSAVLNVSHPESYLLDLVLETPLNEVFFDLPITLNVSFPQDWIDLEIWRRGAPYIHHTKDAEDHRYLMVDIKANERIRIVQANLNPSIDIFNPYPEMGVPFYPAEGQSSDLFHFFLNYTSVMNRPPSGWPMIWFDLNGDGDLDDMVNGFQEGRLNMSKTEISDNDYTDGCIYFIENWFPPGTNIRIRFSAADIEGLEVVSSTGMGDWMDGPYLNDPPDLGGGPDVYERHDPSPIFSWPQANDPDGDPLTFELVLSYSNMTRIWNITTNKTAIKYPGTLEFFTDHHVSLSCFDGRGGVSETSYLTFNLSNLAPKPILNVELDYRERLIPRFKAFGPRDLDPDGDPVTITLELYENSTDGPIHVLSMSQEDNRTFEPNIDLKDHTNYSIHVWTSDQFGYESTIYKKDFYCNFAPEPVTGSNVMDLTGEENGLVISWDANEEDDLDRYIVYRFRSNIIPSEMTNAEQLYNVTGSSSLIDRNVTDGKLYWYSIVGVDLDGEFDVHNATFVNGTPIDDVAPPPVNNITVTFQEQDAYNNARMLIEWNASDDGRFLGYRVYRSLELIGSIEDLTPIHYYNGTSNMTSLWDHDIEENGTYYYTVTSVDLYSNEVTTGLNWVSGTYPYVPAPTPSADDDDTDDHSGLRNSIIWASIGAIFLLLIGIIYLSFILMQRKTRYYDEFEE